MKRVYSEESTATLLEAARRAVRRSFHLILFLFSSRTIDLSFRKSAIYFRSRKIDEKPE